MLWNQFYVRLKENIKDKMAYEKRLTLLKTMQEVVIEIDTRFYKRLLEKKGIYTR